MAKRRSKQTDQERIDQRIKAKERMLSVRVQKKWSRDKRGQRRNCWCKKKNREKRQKRKFAKDHEWRKDRPKKRNNWIKDIC